MAPMSAGHAKVPSLSDLVFPEPHLVDVDADGDVEVVLLDHRHGCAVAMLPLESDVDGCLAVGHRQAHADACAVVTDVAPADVHVVVVVETSHAEHHGSEV